MGVRGDEDIQDSDGRRLASDPGLQPRTKHIDVKYFYLMERVQAGDIQVIKHPGMQMVADALTKALGPIKFLEHIPVMCTKEREYMRMT